MNIDLPASTGAPILHAQSKAYASDFIVQEIIDFTFDDTGEHLYLHIRKNSLNTHDVVQQLQTYFQCESVDIGVAGLKDKKAITDQWISIRTPHSIADVQLPTAEQHDVESIEEGEFVVLRTCRHSRKLRRGAHQANRFIITLRDVKSVSGGNDEHLAAMLDQRMQQLLKHGFVNYFGPQRFGFDAQNLVKADRMFSNPKRRITRTQRGLYLSAARSQLFNLVCAARVEQNTWNTPLIGEPMLLDGSNSYFQYTALDEAVIQRCNEHDIHPTGPLWGKGDSMASGDCIELENAVLEKHERFRHGLERAGLQQQRRALRARIHDLQVHWDGVDVIKFDFKLLKGVYATSFLGEFMINYSGE